MKKILLLAFTILSINSVFAQSQRTIFVEEFTQASCPPCETTTPALNSILNANADKLVQLRYQTSWPGVDPMNADNPVEVQDRVDYYGVTGVPSVFLDGASPVGAVFPELITQANINNAYSIESPVSMTLDHTLSDDLATISVTVTITNEGTEAYNVATNRLRVALMEEEISWDIAPGSTSITVFEAVMKAFITGTAGMEIPEIAAGETWTNTWENIPVPPRIYDFHELGVVAFIQNDADRKMAQSAHSSPKELTLEYPDASIISTTGTDGDLCDYSFVGTATVTNQSNIDAVGYSVEMYLNGALSQTKTFEETLAAGTSVDVTFDEITLPAGSSVFGYILRVAQGDISTADNLSEVGQIGKVAGIAESINNTYEDDPLSIDVPVDGSIVDVPFSLLNFTVISAAVFGISTPLGGYAESDNSLSVNLWSWSPEFPSTGSMIIADQYVVPETGIGLSFDYAYRAYENSQDRLAIEISTDCGQTYDVVFDKAGTDLETTPELNASRFLPQADQWKTVKIDLGAYAGETILVKFKVVSDWGDMMYLDNIALSEITDVNELNADESLEVFPNPAHSMATVQLKTPSASNVQLRVIDMLGRTVKSENLGNVSGQMSYSLDVSSIENGSYLVLLNVDGRDVVKRLSIAH